MKSNIENIYKTFNGMVIDGEPWGFVERYEIIEVRECTSWASVSYYIKARAKMTTFKSYGYYDENNDLYEWVKLTPEKDSEMIKTLEVTNDGKIIVEVPYNKRNITVEGWVNE